MHGGIKAANSSASIGDCAFPAITGSIFGVMYLLVEDIGVGKMVLCTD